MPVVMERWRKYSTAPFRNNALPDWVISSNQSGAPTPAVVAHRLDSKLPPPPSAVAAPPPLGPPTPFGISKTERLCVVATPSAVGEPSPPYAHCSAACSAGVRGDCDAVLAPRPPPPALIPPAGLSMSTPNPKPPPRTLALPVGVPLALSHGEANDDVAGLMIIGVAGYPPRYCCGIRNCGKNCGRNCGTSGGGWTYCCCGDCCCCCCRDVGGCCARCCCSGGVSGSPAVGWAGG